MITDITLGQFFPGNSLVHRLDPRAKLLLTPLMIVFLFVANGFASLWADGGAGLLLHADFHRADPALL